METIKFPQKYPLSLYAENAALTGDTVALEVAENSDETIKITKGIGKKIVHYRDLLNVRGKNQLDQWSFDSQIKLAEKFIELEKKEEEAKESANKD